MIYKTFQKVSNVCQLLDKSKFNPSQTINGITFTNNGDGTITVNGTATSRALYGMYASRYFPSTLIGHKCLIKSNVPSLDANIMTIHSSRWEVSDAKPIGELVATSNIYISVFQGYTVNNIVFKPQLFDLTEMYGAGNEPTTVEQFRQDFPEEMYDYSPHCFIKSYKTLLKASDYCQFIKPNLFYNPTSSGLTITNNGDTFTVNGTTTKKSTIGTEIKNWTPIIGHKILVSGCPEGGGANTFSLGAFNQQGAIDYGNGAIGSVITTGKWFGILFESGVTFNNLIFKPQLFDLTEMYGAGNEPTTIERFRQDFPEEIYDYKPYSTIPSYKKSLVCKTKNLFDNIVPANNCRVSFATSRAIATQISADTDTTGLFKIVSYNGSSYEVLSWVHDVFTRGRVISTFTTPETTGYKHIVFGLNGAKIDTTCLCEINLKPSTTYTFSCNFTNITQGSISWTDMQLEEGSTATEYHPYGYL